MAMYMMSTQPSNVIALEHDKARGEERVEVRDAPVEGLELRILVPVIQRHAHQLRVHAGWSVVSVVGQGRNPGGLHHARALRSKENRNFRG